MDEAVATNLRWTQHDAVAVHDQEPWADLGLPADIDVMEIRHPPVPGPVGDHGERAEESISGAERISELTVSVARQAMKLRVEQQKTKPSLQARMMGLELDCVDLEGYSGAVQNFANRYARLTRQ